MRTQGSNLTSICILAVILWSCIDTCFKINVFPPKPKKWLILGGKTMEKPGSVHHFESINAQTLRDNWHLWPGHGARLSSSRFGWQSRGRGSLRLSFVPWSTWNILSFRLMAKGNLKFIVWYGEYTRYNYTHKEWNISAGIHMYIVHTHVIYIIYNRYYEYRLI